ncbi:hypothetical protein ACGF5C_29830 [Micromonospora sp. NPDC047620]|uniref:hypothetical protein n=1 Tax=Micromonospora sp. NPDC047620 TaxID=3364251 RepID=UPI00372028A1
MTRFPPDLTLAEGRADSPTGWNEDTPPPGASFGPPAAPPVRAGITVNAAVDSATVRGNRVWDHRDEQSQTHAFWITPDGSCVSCRIEDNDFAGNAVGPVRLDTPPVGGRWDRNHHDEN